MLLLRAVVGTIMLPLPPPPPVAAIIAFALHRGVVDG
jgi:hypothetical protein